MEVVWEWKVGRGSDEEYGGVVGLVLWDMVLGREADGRGWLRGWNGARGVGMESIHGDGLYSRLRTTTFPSLVMGVE